MKCINTVSLWIVNKSNRSCVRKDNCNTISEYFSCIILHKTSFGILSNDLYKTLLNGT